MSISPKTQLLHLTVEEFAEVYDTIVNRKQEPSKENREYVYGLKGLAKLLGCSRATASKIKSSGKIDDAIHQEGYIIVIDKLKALELLGKEK